MRIQGWKKWVAMMVSVSCFTGAGPFSMFGAEPAKDTKPATGQEADIKPAAGQETYVKPETRQETENGVATETESQAAEPTRISWWICPTGAYSDKDRVQKLVDEFEAQAPWIDVDYRILDEENGAKEIDTALHSDGGKENEDRPDVVLGAPEYLVTQWGAEGFMSDLSELWDEETQSEFRPEMRDAVKSRDDVWYAVPIYRDLYTMAINYDRFEEAGALQYLNEAVHSWKDSGFIDAVLRIHDDVEQKREMRIAESEETDVQNPSESESSPADAKTLESESSHDAKALESESSPADAPAQESDVVGRVYCKDQTGQRAFMSFVSNFFNTGIIDEYHSMYQLKKGNICNVFGTLRRLVGKGIEFDAGMDGNDENEAFLNQEVFLTFNWSASKQIAARDAGFRIFPMMYPNSKNLPNLTGPVGALGVMENSDKEKKDAAISFVRFFMTDENAYVDAVLASGGFPARYRINGRELTRLYGSDETMRLYETLNDYYGDYMPVMELFGQLEAAWPEMIQKIAGGSKIKTVMKEENESLNKELEEVYGIHPIELDEEAG